MSARTWEFQTPWIKKFIAVGEKRGEARQAKTLLIVLRARGIEVSDDVADRILSCKQLDLWARRASRVDSVEELLGEPAAAVAP